MPNETVNYHCPACGGSMRYDGELAKLRCDFCDSTFTVAQIEALYAQQQQRADSAAEATNEQAAAGTLSDYEVAGRVAGEGKRTVAESLADAREVSAHEVDPIKAFLDRASWNESERAGLRTYTCSSCGAALTVDASQAVAECPYCGSSAVVPGALTAGAKPEMVIPFRVKHDDAQAALASYYKGKKFLPKAFASNNRIAHIQGVYVPFWLYDSHASGRASFEATNTHSYISGDYRVTKTDVYDVRRAGSLAFSRVPADSSSKMPNAHMDAIEPFDYGELTDFSTAYLTGYLAERYDIEATECRPHVEQRMKHSMLDSLQSTVTGYGSVCLKSGEAQVSWKDLHYALLPVWLLHTQWQGDDYLFAMNGQTGRFIGNLPVDKFKVALWFVGIFLLAAAAIWAICIFLLDMADDSLLWPAVIGVGAAIAAGICWMFYAEMKTAHERSEAAEYISTPLELSEKSDRYVTTRVTRTHIERSNN
ncbi:TFIIB-type zinc ribbon-containing protein [Olegusella massiliensis]|uniref:hypothetical protein n=1 Tax=Olegusella massiliensis TaxID=1776381 RepID=UPI00083960AE|nr:hypothetical protein [Olegusella massiliensis]